jgi:hypothetical protein
MEDVTPRQLLKQLGNGYGACTILTPGLGVGVVTTGEGWESITPDDPAVNQVILANRTYIDLAGYTQKDLTTFVQSVAVQHMRDPLSTGSNLAAPVEVVWAYDFVTTRRITDAELSNLFETAPGYLGSTLDLMEMVYGQHRTYALNANIDGTFITTDSDTLGSGNPSAADRLHWTRVYYFSPGGIADDTVQLQIYSANLVCQAVTGKEKDLVYIERLRRSYTQQRSEA